MLAETLFQDQTSLANKLIKLEHQNQVNLNARLDKMRFSDYTESEFNSTKPHKSDEVSFVTNSSGDVSMYKGDVLLSGKGGNIQVNYAYITDRDRVDGSVEQQVGYRRYYGNYVQEDKTNNDIYTGADERNRKLGNIIVNGLQVGLDSDIDVNNMGDKYPIRAPAFAGGLCPYISFDVYREPIGSLPRETLEYWIQLEEIYGKSSLNTIETQGLLVPDSFTFYYKIVGKRTIHSSTAVVQDFDILDLDSGGKRLFTSDFFNVAITTHKDAAMSINGLRLACSNVEYYSSSGGTGKYFQIKNPILSVNFSNSLTDGNYVSDTQIPYVIYTSYLKESATRPFGLRFDPSTGEELKPPRMIFSDNNEREMAYIVSFKDDEKVRP